MTISRWDSVTLESVLLALFVGVTVLIFFGSFNLNSESSALFPRLSSGIVIILLVLMLLWRFIPDRVIDHLPDHEALSYGDEDTETEDRDERDVHVIFIMFAGFIFSASVIGFFFAAPVYVYANLKYFKYGSKKRKLLIVGLTVVTISIAYEVLRIPAYQGLLWESLI